MVNIITGLDELRDFLTWEKHPETYIQSVDFHSSQNVTVHLHTDVAADYFINAAINGQRV